EGFVGVMNDLTADPHSRDGIPHRLFPLSADDLDSYRFSLKGQTTIDGRRAWDIVFEPVESRLICIQVGEEQPAVKVDLHGDTSEAQQEACRPWKGEVWIDAEELQPVRIDTQMARGIPWGVRVFLGTNIRQLGFSLTYQRVAENVWFPATYGTEFRVAVLWGYKRTITMSMENGDFRRTEAKSTVTFGH
ncbi:MAG: hypothetical protein KGN84_00080, partial [Acidobacteriota bacterium]|nr:hypothetical protein [Acidobacteriota bacterium]